MSESEAYNNLLSLFGFMAHLFSWISSDIIPLPQNWQQRVRRFPQSLRVCLTYSILKMDISYEEGPFITDIINLGP